MRTNTCIGNDSVGSARAWVDALRTLLCPLSCKIIASLTSLPYTHTHPLLSRCTHTYLAPPPRFLRIASPSVSSGSLCVTGVSVGRACLPDGVDAQRERGTGWGCLLLCTARTTRGLSHYPLPRVRVPHGSPIWYPYPYPRGFLPVPAAGLPDPWYTLGRSPWIGSLIVLTFCRSW